MTGLVAAGQDPVVVRQADPGWAKTLFGHPPAADQQGRARIAIHSDVFCH